MIQNLPHTFRYWGREQKEHFEWIIDVIESRSE